MRKTIFAEGEFYHLYNRGTDKRDIFLDDNDFTRFLKSMAEFNVIEPIGSIFENSFRRRRNKKRVNDASRSLTPDYNQNDDKNDIANTPDAKLISIVAYCLNRNHYHLLIEQVSEKGVEKFMQRLGTGYTKYFNNKYDRNGVLFQGKFKSVHVDSNEYLLHVSAYVNLNNRVHQLGSPASKLHFRSSWNEYTSKKQERTLGLCDKEIILGQFKETQAYVTFSEISLKGMKERKGSIDESVLLE